MTHEYQYAEYVDPCVKILSVEEFMVGCRRGTYLDSNGSGHPATDIDGDYMMDDTHRIYPSKRHTATPPASTHIAWVSNE